MTQKILVRNVSHKPLTLVSVEYIDAAVGSRFDFRSFDRAFARVTNSVGLTNSTTRRAVPRIASNAQAFTRRDVSIQLPPFTIVTTDIPTYINKTTERIRLTFQLESGERHQMICPVPTSESASLIPQTPDPSERLTGVYLPASAFVALFISSNLDSWMNLLGDQIPLGALSIPGTHNTPTCFTAPPSVRCQAVSPYEQLVNGVRFFDIRVQVADPDAPGSDKLILVHSVFPVALSGSRYFREVYNDTCRFLKEHPSETLIMSIKREGTGKGTDEQLSKVLRKHYTNEDQWFTEPRVPKLGEVRGKIVLVRRFDIDDSLQNEWEGKGWAIDAQGWEKNTPNSFCPSGDLCVQDFFRVMETPTIEQKIIYARNHLERSGCCKFDPSDPEACGMEKIPLYLNFLSASNFFKVGTWPEKIAARVNPSIVEHLCKKHMIANDGGIREGNWSTGILVTDWVGLDGDWDLVRCCVGMNTKLIR